MKRYIRADVFDNDDIFNQDETVRRNLARNTDNEELMEVYRYDPSDDVKVFLANNPNLPYGYMEQMLTDEDPAVRMSLALNHSVPVEFLDILAKDPETYVRVAVAENEKTTLDVLSMLANDKEHLVLMAVASNKNTPLQDLGKLSRGAGLRNRSIVVAVINNPSTTDDILREISSNLSIDSFARYEAKQELIRRARERGECGVQ